MSNWKDFKRGFLIKDSGMTFWERIGDYVRFVLIFLVVVFLMSLFFPHKAHAASYSYSYVGGTWYPTVSTKHPTNMVVQVRNTGSVAWPVNGAVKLGTAQANDRVDAFSDSSWLSSNRIALTKNATVSGKQTIDPNEVAEFDFTMTAWDNWPGQLTGTFPDHLNLVWEGVTWFPDINMYWNVTIPAPVGTILFDWYGPGEHRWSDISPVKTVDTPQFGTVNGHYSSDDINVTRQQLTAIRDLGIDYVIFDFWLNEPYGQGLYTRTNAINDVALLKAEFPTLKFSFLIENSGGGAVPQYVYNDFYNLYGNDPQWYRYLGYPTLFTYTLQPIYDPHFATLKWQDSDFASNSLYWVRQPMMIRNRAATIMGSLSNLSWCTQANTQCWNYDGAWNGNIFNDQTQAALANRSALDVMVIYGWNEYYERSQLEPNHRPDSPRGPTYMYDLFRNWINAWHTQ